MLSDNSYYTLSKIYERKKHLYARGWYARLTERLTDLYSHNLEVEVTLFVTANTDNLLGASYGLSVSCLVLGLSTLNKCDGYHTHFQAN